MTIHSAISRFIFIHDDPGFYSPPLSNHMMRSFFFSCAVLCATGLVGALPSAVSPDSLGYKHPMGKRQESYLTADVQQPLGGDCTISDVRFSARYERSPTERNQDRIASSSDGPILTGKWKKMGDCPSKQVQIQEFKYDYLRFST